MSRIFSRILQMVNFYLQLVFLMEPTACLASLTFHQFIQRRAYRFRVLCAQHESFPVFEFKEHAHVSADIVGIPFFRGAKPDAPAAIVQDRVVLFDFEPCNVFRPDMFRLTLEWPEAVINTGFIDACDQGHGSE